jgi:uncharacterized membrane protein YhhN
MGPVVLCALGVVGLLIAEQRGAQPGIWIAKPVASASFIWAAVSTDALATVYGALVLIGLVLCMLGDLLLIPGDRPRVFRAGLFAFLLGHVVYGAGFLTQPLSPPGLAWGGVLLAVVVAGVMGWLGRSLPADMVVPVRAYMLVIGIMATLACGVTVAGGPWQVAAGALAFTVSDVAVARDRFVKKGFVNRAWGLPLYYSAQLLLAATPALVS